MYKNKLLSNRGGSKAMKPKNWEEAYKKFNLIFKGTQNNKEGKISPLKNFDLCYNKLFADDDIVILIFFFVKKMIHFYLDLDHEKQV